jgi:Leucine-rich repeat (LRR) protein
VAGMKTTLLILMAVALVGCGTMGCGTTSWVSDPSDPNNVTIEAAIRKKIKKPTGELTKADLEKVTYLNLARNKLTNVKGLEKLNQLKKGLNLTFNKLTDVKGLENLTQLTELWLNGNQLTEVKGLEKLTQLSELGLGDNQLTDIPKGLEKLTKLKVLKLGSNKLTDVKGLENLTQLEELYLYGNPDLTKAQIAELQKALPKCKIHSNPTK